MEKAKEEVMKFVNDRNWGQYHSLENLSKSICIEAAELLECFQWDNNYDETHVKEELADVLIYCIQFANKLGVDMEDIILEKLVKNAKKYPLNQGEYDK